MLVPDDEKGKGIVISLWTIVQTCFHVTWAVLGYCFYSCKLKPSNYIVVMMYLTYFYNYTCGNPKIGNSNIFSAKNIELSLIPLDSNGTFEDDSLYNILYTVLEKGSLPPESKNAYRTQIYFQVYIILDGLWIITALLLFVGSYYQIKKCASLVFYGPWLLLSGMICLLDVVSAVHFGLDLLQIKNYTTWLKFIGVRNYDDFAIFNKYASSKYFPQGPSTVMALLLSRLMIFWVLNVICFFHVMNLAALAYQGSPSSRNRNGGKRRNQRPDLDSSASRIRNWQLFYGAIEISPSTVSSASGNSLEMDQNSNSRSRRSSGRMNSTSVVRPVFERSQSSGSTDYNIAHISSINESPKESISMSSQYKRFSDVAEGLDTRRFRKSSVDSLRGQLPWTYIKSTEVGPRASYNSATVPGNSTGRNRQKRNGNNMESTAM
ncbi:hypothetical protein JTB14_012626 [Gonioctena quinquepunctata]|nr:hypothetical protein JTB14_012626 [Gonioctena quinquepunctata]